MTTVPTTTLLDTDDLVPARYRVIDRREELPDTATLVLEPVDRPLPVFRPGQFAMLYAYGVGEIPISLSGSTGSATLYHTVRAVGPVSAALHRTAPGDLVGVRGPYGVGWPLPPACADVVVVAGGVGLAPLRPMIRHLLDRHRGRSLTVLVGARRPEELLYPGEYPQWRRSARVHVTVDHPTAAWHGPVGVVTGLFGRLRGNPDRTCAYLCGPEIMMRFAARDLTALGVPADRIALSLERTMQCGTGHCGHCQLGPLLVCRDGPVVGYDIAAPLLGIAEL